MVFWLPVFAFELSLFVLALRAFIEHIQEIREMNRWNRSSLLNTLIRDSIGYFTMYVAHIFSLFLVVATYYTDSSTVHCLCML